MKQKPASISSQILIALLGALILIFMIQISQAQTNFPLVTQNQNYSGATSSLGNSIQTNAPKKSLGQTLRENTSLGYYQQFLGPTAQGSVKETYNPFLEGRAPLQSFHAFNLRYQFNNNWAMGSTLTFINGYTEEVQNKNGLNKPATEWFNARFYISLPSLNVGIGRLFSTFSYEAPTSVAARDDDMRYGLVISESLALNLPSVAWSAGIMAQYYRAVFTNNVRTITVPSAFGPGTFTYQKEMQTTIVSGGPYINYRFNDKWMMTSLVTFDWDQKGEQTDTKEFNNNLDHRARLGISYFPQIKYLTSVGLFTQGLLKFRPGTTAFGAEMALKF